MVNFSEKLRDVRGIQTLECFGSNLGYSKSYVSDIENGRRLPSVNFIDALCRYLNCDREKYMYWHTLGAREHGWRI